MKKIFVLPTWVIVGMCRPFIKKDHIWYGKKFTLKDWAMYSTWINKLYCVQFWLFGLAAIFFIVRHFIY